MMNVFLYKEYNIININKALLENGCFFGSLSLRDNLNNNGKPKTIKFFG